MRAVITGDHIRRWQEWSTVIYPMALLYTYIHRVLPSPVIKYGAGKIQLVKNGTWNTDVLCKAVAVKKMGHHRSRIRGIIELCGVAIPGRKF